MTTESIVIVDYGVGNLRSVQKIFEKTGATAIISSEPETIAAARGLVLPGVGAFGDAMAKLRERKLVELLREQVLERRTPILGICLGMQLLARASSEGGAHEGLGLIDAEVEPLAVAGHRDWAGKKLTLPHIGWNEVRPSGPSRLFEGISAGTDYYFVHGYQVRCGDSADAAASCQFGDEFTCAIERGNIFATQFHPEKSQSGGVRLVENYISLCATVPAGA